MGFLRFSVRGARNLMDIAHYTLRVWGEDQTFRYLADLKACCRKLAGSPGARPKVR